MPAAVGAGRRSWPDAVDGIVDGLVAAFALWTLWYEIALTLQLDLRASGWPFVLLAVAAAAFGAVRSLRAGERAEPHGRHADPTSPSTSPPTSPSTSPFTSVAARWGVAGAALALLVVLVAMRERLGVLPSAILAILLLVVVAWPVVVASWRRGARRPHPEPPGVPRRAEHLLAGMASVGTGVLSLFVFKPDADDVFYLNRAAWVAGHGNAALDDTMFGPGNHPQSFGGGLPTPSIEALQGVLASMLHVEAATIAYLVYAPVMAAAFGWVTWRLVRTWAPRRHLLVLLVALLFVLASGASIVGNYSIGRIWQGKVTAYAVLLPLVWTYLSRLVLAPARRWYLLLLASGVSFVGLTTSSALLTPVVAGAAFSAALALRSRALALGAVAFMVAPVANGLVQKFGPAPIGTQSNTVTTPTQVFAIAFGPASGMVALALVATVLAGAVARRPASVVVCAAGVATLATFLPGVIALADAATGAGPVVWRLAITAPVWVFVGLVAAVPLPSTPALGRWGGRLALGAVVVTLAVVPVLDGRWLWSPGAGARLTSTPVWKVDPVALADVRAAQRLDVAPGLWLMPPAQMEELAISTAGPYAVVPRRFYLDTLEAPASEIRDRRTLLGLVAARRLIRPSASEVRGALARLGVSLACVPGDAPGARRLLAEVADHDLRKVGSMSCHVPAR